MPTIEFPNELFNEAYLPLFDVDTRYNIVYGGAGGGKSEFLVQRDIIRRYEKSGFRTMWVRKSYEHIRESVYQTFKYTVENWGLWKDFRFYRSPLLIEAKNGYRVLFKGVNDPDALKSLAEVEEVKMEEADQFDLKDFNQLDLRLRGQQRKRIFLIFNPIDIDHWLKTDVVDKIPDDVTILRTTYKDNRFVGDQYAQVMERLKEVDPVYYQVYAMGEWGIIKPERPFADKFDKKKHVKRGLTYDPDYELFLKWDFNVDNTCIVGQNVFRDDGSLVIRDLKEYHQSGWDLERICMEITTDYPGAILKINGDASGKAGNALTSGNQSAYDIIKETLNLNWTYNFNVPNSNPSHLNSRLLTNLILKTPGLYEIDEEGCPRTIKDFERVYVDKKGSLDECKRKNPELTHFLDPVRYHFNAEHYERIKEIGYAKLLNQ